MVKIMKLYKTLSGLGKTVKFGLAGAAFYAATLALPIHATVKQESVNLTDKAVIVEQAGDLHKETLQKCSVNKGIEYKLRYESELYSAVKDKKLISSEIESLHGILTKYLEAKDKKYLVAPIKNLDDVKTEGLEPRRVVVKDSIDSIIQDFEREILIYYPGLSSEDKKNVLLKYDAFRTIKEGKTLKELIKKVYEIKKVRLLRPLLDKESYEVKDIVIFNEFLESLKFKDISSSSDIKPVKKLDLSDEQLKFVNDSYKAYLDARDKEFARAKKYWGAGIDMVDNAGLSRVGLGTNFFKKEMVADVKEALILQGYTDVDISKFYKGVGFKGRFPQIPNWAMFAFGLGFPFLRTALITKYTRRQYDPGDLIGNLLSVMLGGILIDSVHPLVFPIRMFALPFITEPIRKVFNIYPDY